MTDAGDGTLADVDSALVASFVVPPALPEATTLRPRLLRRLARASAGPVTLVSGEPASGKTTLVVQWLASDACEVGAVAWFTVPPGSGEEVLFWRYVIAALAARGLELADLRASLLDGEPPTDEWLTTLANRLGRIDDSLVVVLDDLHELESAGALAGLRTLLDRIPRNVSFILVSQSAPPWSLSEWRMSGRLAEIDSSDLRLTLDESQCMLDATGIVGLSEHDVALLHHRTEGWVGGVKLAAISLRKSSDPSRFIARFAADDELVSGYLLRDVLERQDPEVRAFLLDASVLDEVSAEVCDALRERTDSDVLIGRCFEANLFVSRVAAGAAAYRFHPMVRQLLAARLAVVDPERLTDLHRRASRIFEERGDVHSAIAHAVATGDDQRTGSLVARHAGHLAHRGQFDELRSWRSILRGSTSVSLPETMLGLASAMSLSGLPDDALHILDELTVTDMPDDLRYAVEQLRGASFMARGDVDRLCQVARNLATQAPQDGWRLPFEPNRFISYLDGIGSYFQDDLLAARAACERATRARERPDLFFVEVPGWLALVDLAEGRLGEAERHARESLTRQVELHSAETAVAVPALLALAGVAWERHELGPCQEWLSRARRSLRPLLWEVMLVECLNSRLCADRGQARRALTELEESGRLYLVGGSSALRAVTASRAIDLALRIGDVGAAGIWSHEYARNSTRPLPWALQVRLAHTRSASAAAALLAEALAADEPVPRRVDTLLAVAAVELAIGEHGLARRHLGEALALAEPQGFIGRFCGVEGDLRSLLGEVVADPTTAAAAGFSPYFATAVGDACRPQRGRGPAPPPVPELVEQLSSREIEVLSLLADGLSYVDIGSKLYVSRNTVKTHLRHAYTKLGVSSRSAAIETGRRLGLV